MSTLVTIATYDNVFQAELAKSLLEENGIQTSLQNENMLSLYPSFAADLYGVRLQVSSEDKERALELLEAIDDSYFTQKILEEAGALLNGHFRLTSGRHSRQYIEKIKIIQDPEKISPICCKLAKRLSSYEPELVVGPAYGGIVLAYEVARFLGKRFLFTQRKDETMTIRSGFDIHPGMKAVVIEDIVTTGGSVKEVIACLQAVGIDVVAVGVIVDRSGGNVDFGIPVESMLTLDIETFDEADCPECALQNPITKPGSSDKK